MAAGVAAGAATGGATHPLVILYEVTLTMNMSLRSLILDSSILSMRLT